MADKTTTPMGDSISGAKVRSGHRASLFGVLGASKMIDIHSGGVHFAMKGHFPYRSVLGKVAKFTESDTGTPTRSNFTAWANAISVEGSSITPAIQIAETGDLLTRRAYMALIGGANHEGFHRLYTGQGYASAEDLSKCVLDGFKPGVPYHKYAALLASAQNYFEDVRIERIGCAEFPGVYTKMADLADFVLDQEAPVRTQDLAKGARPSSARIALSVIREVGLGYNTIKAREAVAHYRRVAPAIVDLVLKGALSPLLREIIPSVKTPRDIDRAKSQVGLSTTLALRFITVLHELSLMPPPPPPAPPPPPGQKGKSQPQPSQGEPGESEPSEGQPSGKSEDKSESKDKPKSSKGKPESDEDPQDTSESKPSKGKASKDESNESDESEDDSDESDESSDSEGADEGEDDPNKDSGSKSEDESDSKDEGGSKGESDEDESDEDDSEGESDSDEDSDDSEGGDSDEDSEDDSEDDSDEDGSEGDSGDSGSDSETSGGEASDSNAEVEGGGGAGGKAPEDPGATAADILNSDTKGMQDYASALEAAVKEALKGEDKSMGRGEQPYRPYTTEGDRVEVVSGDVESGRAMISRLVKETKRETSFLRSKLRTMFKALEDGSRLHGVRKGSNLSERFLVDTLTSIRAGQEPSRAFHEDTTSMDTSISACVVIDESGSMQSKLKETSAILYSLGEALDSIDAKFSMVGFRDGYDSKIYAQVQDSTTRDERSNGSYHRMGESIVFDVFKTFEDRFKTVSWRLGKVRATGGTPMADGVEFALDALSKRREGHRIMFVVTDGQPDPRHASVLKGQVRRAQEAGIHVIGIGLGYGSEYVTTTFPDSVYAPRLDKIPALLVAKLHERVRKIGVSKRGMKVKAS